MVVPSNSDKTNSTKQNGKHQGRISIFETQASMTDPCISCTTFNILAPVYKRLDTENQSLRESEYRVYWLTRNQSILDWLLCERSSIICLQEFWVGNEDLVHMYENRLSDAGYLNFKLARTNNRGDGLFTAVNKDYFRVVSYRELLFNDFGDRVAQLLHVESVVPLSQNWSSFVQPEILIVNTHLLFPHNSSLSVVRLHQWVSHSNHRGNICGVDFIWLLNPDKYQKPLRRGWSEAVFSIIKCQIYKSSLAESDAFASLKADNHGDYITYSGFCKALGQLGLTGHPHGLSIQEMNDLWTHAVTDEIGAVDYKELQQQIWDSTKTEEVLNDIRVDVMRDTEKQAICLNVKNAVLFPPEVEKGMWPENYSLSDHARLTVVFSPVRMSCSLPIC
ncbi:uncharacterized calcium-binding protein At1g02270 isoform X6 [Macadamia integrifolia]|uniref:uncharacterized calcium-binding protein At1g02270 isoform X6 n=1 Tax=Macadamia integrifolia TaxID=60698 RepID=UPI001C4E33F6|nr:uncharacterized calcium-binding protein At1g02270 isoform X6 [Macadamia integrifolia]